MGAGNPDHGSLGPRFDAAIAAIDAANADDPHTLAVTVNGTEATRPKELAHAELVTDWVGRLVDQPSEELLLAARAHHLRRWTVPRDSYPTGRAGYLKWRRDLHHRHAEEVGEILEACGYDPQAIARVQDLVQKKGLGRATGTPAGDEVQALEDALCLVFIETQFRELAERLDDDKMVDVVAKTLRKMSDAGRTAALGVDLAPADRAIVERAVERLGHGDTGQEGT